jgi:hypothetical protein
MRVALTVSLLVLAGGCELWDPRPGMRDFFYGLGDSSAPDPNAEIRKKEYPTWPKEIREAVDERLVLVGMTKNQVLVTIRLAENDIPKQIVETADGKIENWTLWRVANGWTGWKMLHSQMVTVSIRNDTVSQIEFHTEAKDAKRVPSFSPSSPPPPQKHTPPPLRQIR